MGDWIQAFIKQWEVYAAVIGAIAFFMVQFKKICKIIHSFFSAINYVFTKPIRVVEDLSNSIKKLTDVVGDVQKRLDVLSDSIKNIEHNASNALAKSRMLFESSKTAYFECSFPNGSCIWSNGSLQKMFHLTYDQIIGDGWLVALHPDDLEETRERWLDTVHHWRPYRTRYRLLINGKETLVEASAEVIKDDKGNPLTIWGKVEYVDEKHN